jgi:hypothetical protein
LNGYTYLTKIELIFTIKATGTFRWAPFLGECLLGDEYTIKYQNEVIKKQNVDALHFRRVLEMDQSSEMRNSYLDGVKSDRSTSSDGDKTFTLIVPIDMPYTADKALVMLAHSAEHELSFTIPALTSLINKAALASPDAVNLGPSTPTNATVSCFLRCHVCP